MPLLKKKKKEPIIKLCFTDWLNNGKDFKVSNFKDINTKQ